MEFRQADYALELRAASIVILPFGNKRIVANRISYHNGAAGASGRICDISPDCIYRSRLKSHQTMPQVIQRRSHTPDLVRNSDGRSYVSNVAKIGCAKLASSLRIRQMAHFHLAARWRFWRSAVYSRLIIWWLTMVGLSKIAYYYRSWVRGKHRRGYATIRDALKCRRLGFWESGKYLRLETERLAECRARIHVRIEGRLSVAPGDSRMANR